MQDGFNALMLCFKVALKTSLRIAKKSSKNIFSIMLFSS